MFKFCSLFSGSTGNSLFVETENSKILVDAGESAKKIVSALSLIGIEVTDIDAILVTHEHIDHVKSLGTLSKKYNIPVYANENTWNAMPEQQAKILEENQKKFSVNKEFEIKDLEVYCAPSGGSIGTITFEPGFSFSGVLTIFEKNAALYAKFTDSGFVASFF